MLNGDSISMIITVMILAATVILFIWGKFRTDVVAMCALLGLILSKVLTPGEAFSGFSNNVIFIMAGMFIISGAIVRSGLASVISNTILGIAGKNTNVLFMTVMLLAAGLGSLVSNTGVVAIMMPIVVSMSMAIDESPGRFLMPLAFMSSIGGMFTLIGNSPNMVVNDAYVKAGFPSLSLFSFFPVGLVCFLFGMLVLAPVTSLYLSRRKNVKGAPKDKRVSLRELAAKYRLSQNLFTVTVPSASPVAGKILCELHMTQKFGVTIQEINRQEQHSGYFHLPPKKMQFCPGPQTLILAGDVLRVLGSQVAVKAFADACQLQLAKQGENAANEEIHFSSIGICELVLMSSSRLINRTVIESGLREQFGITVLGIQRGDQYILENIKDQVMQSGDALLVQGTWDNLSRLEGYSMNWVVVGRPKDLARSSKRYEKIPLVVTVLAIMIGIMTFTSIPAVVAVVLAALALIFGGCFKNMDEAYSSISWETLVLIASLLPIALAMEKTGLVDVISARMVALCAAYGPYVGLAVIYAAASGMNIVMSTTPVALLISPVAVQVALSMGFSPLPFLFAVATAASMCFATPFSTPPNALVMSAGRYTFSDYAKVGLPLQIAMGVVMVLVLPVLFPFTPH